MWLAALPACDRPAPGQPPPLEPSSTPSVTADGACATPELRAEVVLFSLDGACLPSASIVLYTCPTSDVPVLRLASSGGAVSFLGGPFAVPVETVPANVRFVGHGDGAEVLVADPVAPVTSPSPSAASPGPSEGPPGAEPADLEPLVYVRREGVTERWLRLERRRAVAEPPVLWMIGDSLLDGGQDDVTSALADWALTLDAEVGRPSSSGVELAADAVEAEADVVVVELGTNDSSPSTFREHLVETLELLRSVPFVVWQTVRGPEGDLTMRAVDAAIREVVSDYPNASLADWAAFVPEDGLMDDGVHPAEGFEGLEAELLVPILTAWRSAVTGTEVTSCSRPVLRATA
jgi:hypothetical protein